MKKHILIVLLGVTLAASMTTAAFADMAQDQKPIESAEQLKSAIALAMEDGQFLETEEEQIMAQATEDAIAELVAEKLDAAVEVLNREDVNQSMQQLSDGSQHVLKTYDLGDGCQMTVELRDQADGVQAGTAMPLAVTGEWKPYGNRYFTAKATVTAAGYEVMLGLENHYVLSSNGIDEDYGKPIDDPGKGKCIISRGNYFIEDGTARTPGASDVNMYCTFTCKASSTTSKYKLDTAVQYLAHDTIGKRIKVGHTWKLTKLS